MPEPRRRPCPAGVVFVYTAATRRRAAYCLACGAGRAEKPIVPREGAALLSKIEKLCLDKGMKMTGQRRVIARILSDATDHPDVEEVHRRSSAVDAKISIATVYRTVRLFEEAGIVEKHDFGDGRSRYEEAGDDHHDHLIDIQSGRVIEFRNAEIEALQDKIARQHGFKLVGHRLELFGVPLDGKTEGPDGGKGK